MSVPTELTMVEKLIVVLVLFSALPLGVAFGKWGEYRQKREYEKRTGRSYDIDFGRFYPKKKQKS